jgi:hypothetical protein
MRYVVACAAMRSSRLGSLVLLLAVVLVVGIATMVMRVVTPAPPSAELSPRAPLGPPLTRRLALVVLDGVRLDVATDGRRMPRLAERFRAHAGAALWAEPISMTASAALVIGTGAHAGIDQAIRNETSMATFFEDVFSIARKAQLRTGTVGDPVWIGLYPKGWAVTRAEDVHQLAVGVGDDAARFSEAGAFQALEPPVDVAVYHFATPDHMAHGFGIASPVYEAYIASFDALLATFLSGFSSDTTVIVLGDHGATMSGIHGSDTEEQRRTFMVAYGPGVVPGPRSLPRADQVDLAATMAALLGVATPRHSRGHPLLAWLEESDEARATAACRNVQDLARSLGAAMDGASLAPACDPARSANARVASALPIARDLDARTGEAETAAQRSGFTLSIFATAVTALLGFVIFFRTMPARALVAGGLAFGLALGASIFITAYLERLPGAWLTPARITLYVLFNAPILLWILVPIPTSRVLERATVLAPVLFPGVLVLTESHSALNEAYLLSAVLVAFALTRGIPTSEGFPWAWRSVAPSRLALYGLPLLGASVVCIDAGNFTPAWLEAAPRVELTIAFVSLFAFAGLRHARLKPALWGTVTCALIAAASLALRRSAPAYVCLAGWAVVTLLATVALYRRRRSYAELLAFGSYAWVSRDLEVPFFLATYLVAVGFGDAMGKRLAEQDRAGTNRGAAARILTLSVVTFLFAWGFVQLVGVQLGLHFMHFDFAAGAFRDLGVSMPRIVLALVYKYAVARAFLLFGALLPLPRSMQVLALRSLVALYALRATVLVGSLEAARGSFWTPVWVTSELPHVLLALLMVAVAHALLREPRPLVPEAPTHV